MPQLVIRTRSGRVESTHDGYICVTDSNNKVRYSIGNPEARIFLRSSGKPIYAVVFANSGIIEKFNITLKEFAVICSSHDGQAFHRKIISSVLKKAGLSEKDLECGHKYPDNIKVRNALIKLRARPSYIFSNCSGKHAGLLALCRYYGFPVKDYHKPEHPIQQLIRRTMAELLECDEDELITGRDGCSMPTYNLSLKQAAYLYALLAHGYNGRGKYSHCFGLIQKAMKTYPLVIKGKNTFCTDLNIYTEGRVIGKIGAEGIYCLSIPEQKLGVCIKISDGNPWASYPASVEVLRELGVMDEYALKKLKKWAFPEVKDDKGQAAGHLYPVFNLFRNKGGKNSEPFSAFRNNKIYEPGDLFSEGGISL
jgi:L-asparaginase II